jgi:phosphopentomutase
LKVKRIVTVVLDSVGVGHMPDAGRFKDDETNTLLHVFQQRGKLEIPNLCALGMGQIVDIPCSQDDLIGCYGKMGEKSPNKDTTSGHWELAGLILDSPLPTYPDGFPEDLIEAFEKKIGTKTLGNYPSSGTEIIKELGQEHVKTGYPIVYTSADSVFQIAAHKDVVPLERLYEFSIIARRLLVGEHAVARVIARPFLGADQQFERDNAARKDYSLSPPGETLLDHMKEKGFFVVGVGKIGDIFGHRGLTEEIHTNNNDDGIDKVIESLSQHKDRTGLIIVNLVDFDMVYGHRKDVEGYARALEEFDRRVPQIMDALTKEDVLMITADHGCDPTYPVHTDHTREYVPILIFGEAIKPAVDLGTRDTFADCGQTIADLLGVGPLKFGKSFKGDIIHG